MSDIKILIAFYSRNGSTEALAKAIAEGAQSEGAEVTLRRVREIVSREVMAHAPGWAENADRMNALYKLPLRPTPKPPMRLFSARRPASAMFLRN